MQNSQSSREPVVRLRRALGNIRRSNAVSSTTQYFGLQRRRVQQRLRARFVRGVHLRTVDYLDFHVGSDLGQYFPMVGFDGTTRIEAPTFVPAPPHERIGGRINLFSGPHGVAVLNRPWVVGCYGAVLGQDQKLLWDLSYEWPGQPQHHSCYDLDSVTAQDLPGTTATLAAMGADQNYFHLILNSVARLVYLEQLGLPLPVDQYLIAGEVTPVIADVLDIFGIPRSRLRGTAEAQAFRPEQLIAPPVIQHPFVVPAHVANFVRSKVLAHLPVSASPLRRIFIDRSDAPTRRIANLAELRPVFTEFGIEVVRPTSHSLAEQATFFRDANLVISNHGAALTNLVFCQPGTRVLQVLAPGMMEREYRTLSQHGRLNHDYVVADFASPADAHLALKQRDLVIPPKLLRQILAAETLAP